MLFRSEKAGEKHRREEGLTEEQNAEDDECRKECREYPRADGRFAVEQLIADPIDEAARGSANCGEHQANRQEAGAEELDSRRQKQWKARHSQHVPWRIVNRVIFTGDDLVCQPPVTIGIAVDGAIRYVLGLYALLIAIAFLGVTKFL